MDKEIMNYIDETLIHKQYVLESARILSRYLIEHDNVEMALELVKRCSSHDVSKFSVEEMESLTKISGFDNFINPNSKLNEEEKKAISIHWKNNSHHPEHYADVSEMTDLDIMEMACDCYARSMEYGTDLINFIEIRQNERFKLPLSIYEKYKKYCLILINGGIKQNENKIYINNKKRLNNQ